MALMSNSGTASPKSSDSAPFEVENSAMVAGTSVVTPSIEFDINKMAALRWRHRVLNTVRDFGDATLTGTVEADETFFRESRKGSREWTNHAKGKAPPPRPRWIDYRRKRMPLPRPVALA